MSNPFPLEKDGLLEAYRRMKTIREFEERLHVDFGRGDIPGFVHLYAGEEASGVGIEAQLPHHLAYLFDRPETFDVLPNDLAEVQTFMAGNCRA